MKKKCRILKDGQIIAEEVSIADSFFARMTGLLLHRELPESQGMLIIPCKQVHTLGMKFSIDVVFLSEENQVLGICDSMSPGKISGYIRKAARVLELKAGVAEKNAIKINDHLVMESI